MSDTSAMPARATTSSASRRSTRVRASPQAPEPAPSYHHGDLRNALIREGRATLEEMGIGELSLRAVARRAGVSEAAPSRHFEGKEGLLAAIAAQGFQELAAERQAIAAGEGSALQKARTMMRAYVAFSQRNQGLFNLMVGPRLLDMQPHAELREAGSASFELFADALRALATAHGWEAAQLDYVVHAAWACEHGMATLILTGRAPRAGVELVRAIDFAIDICLSGIVNGPGAVPATDQVPASRRTRRSPTR